MSTQPPPPPDGPDRRIGYGLLFGILVVALAAAAIAAAWFLTRDDDKQATTTTVVTTRPTAAGSKVAVPRLIGLKEPQALVRLGEAGLRPKEVFKPTTKPTKVVVSQSPQEGTEVEKGAQVTLVIDSGAPKVAVPDVVGQPVEAATAKLDALGLDSRQTEVTSSEPPGTAVDQAPAPGTKVAKGSVVTLSVAMAAPATTNLSSGPGTKPQKTVPNVVGQTLDAAVARIRAAGLRTPAAGRTAPQNAQVLIYLGAFRS